MSEIVPAGGRSSAAAASPGTRRLAARLCRIPLLPFHLLAVASAAKSFRDNPVIGSPLLNRHGLHVMRRRIADRLGVRRRRRLAGLVTDAERAAFERDGFIVKPDFLDAATFPAFRAEVLGLETRAREAVIGDTLTRLIPLDAVTLARLPTVRAVLRGARYRAYLDYVGSFRRRPHLYVQTVFSRVREAEPDVQSFFHFDTFHPTVKSWLFLQDVPAEAAPFTYVPGSHRPNRRRLAWERRQSITARDAGDRLTAEGSFRISAREIARLGYDAPRLLPVRANTLIVADTSGIHRRGTPDGQATRLAIWAYSRSNPFLPFTGGDPLALPLLGGRALRFYWAVSDRLKDLRGGRRVWRWAGLRRPLTPPS